MKRKLIYAIAMSCLVGNSFASTVTQQDSINSNKDWEQLLKPLTPTYLDGVYQNDNWSSNWFVSAQGGINTFVGKPVGCGDVFDRVKFSLNLSVGKWVTPYIGGRLVFQGFKLNDYNLKSCTFQNVHADFMYNISSHFRKDFENLSRWDVIPYVGAGIIRNANTYHKPFAMSYGVIGRYRLSKRFHLSAEIGGTTTFRDFDGIGESNKFGDNLLHASVGLTATIGHVGWKRVIDAKPYITQNDALITNMSSLKNENERLSKQISYDEIALAEMRKILEIEGLLDKYHLNKDGNVDSRTYPKNNYSGLNSLRARLRNRNWDGKSNDFKQSGNDTISVTTDNYLKMVSQGKTYIGAPVFFFFRLNSTKLTDISQEINVKMIAQVMNQYHLYAKVIGAAYSKTGTVQGNKKLSIKRAEQITNLLRKYKVQEELLIPKYRGGIDVWSPKESNRNTCILLYAKEPK